MHSTLRLTQRADMMKETVQRSRSVAAEMLTNSPHGHSESHLVLDPLHLTHARVFLFFCTGPAERGHSVFSKPVSPGAVDASICVAFTLSPSIGTDGSKVKDESLVFDCNGPACMLLIPYDRPPESETVPSEDSVYCIPGAGDIPKPSCVFI